MTDHPITPPIKLVQHWEEMYEGNTPEWVLRHVARKAAQWGADQELEACCDVLEGWGSCIMPDLRAARRPKPPSLKEQALEAAHIEVDPQGKNGSLIIRALEALPDD